VCCRGEVLAAECMEVVKTWEAKGPSSVVRLIRDEAMVEAIRKIVGRLGISGFCGFDFMVEAGSGRLLLIEMNLRPTQLVHLALGVGRDLVAAYVRTVVGLAVGDRAAVTGGDLIALFPQELQRDAESEFVGRAYHDVPWGEARLMEVALEGMPEGVWVGLRRG